jgi:hypothetical protein
LNGGTIINSSFDGTLTGNSGGYNNGGLVGSFANSDGGYILLSSSSGAIIRNVGNSTVSGCSGGIAGIIGGSTGSSNGANAVIFASYSTMNVASIVGATANSHASGAGGLAGCVNGTSVRILHSYAAGDLEVAADAAAINPRTVTAQVGGIVARINPLNAQTTVNLTIESSLALGNNLSIDFEDPGDVLIKTYNAGRIYGSQTTPARTVISLDKVYASGDMTFISDDIPTVFNTIDPGEGTISATLPPTQSYYAETLGWDFDNVWKMPEASDELGRVYPILKWQ